MYLLAQNKQFHPMSMTRQCTKSTSGKVVKLENCCTRTDKTRPFQDAVKAGSTNVMCSYNRINETYACGNDKTLNGLLKTELGFQVRAPVQICLSIG